MLQTLASNVRRRILPSAKHHPSDVGQACAIRVMHPDWLLHYTSRVFYDLPHFTYEIVFFAHDHHMSVLRVGSNIQTAKYNVANRQYSFPFSSSPSDRQRHRADWAIPLFLSPSSRSSSSRAIPLFLPLGRYVDLLVSLPFHVAGVWSSADDSMHWLPTDCATEAIDFEGGEEWELWARVRQMREQAGGAG